MKQRFPLMLVLGLVAGCGEADARGDDVDAGGGAAAAATGTEPSPTDRGTALRQAHERILAGERDARGEITCDVLRSGVLTEVFGNVAATATFEPASPMVPQALCTARWDRPGRAELETAWADYNTRKMMATMRNQVFDEPEPPPLSHMAALTIVLESYGSPAEAVAGLESAVATLSRGVSVSLPGGRETTSIVEFEGWLDDVGDLATWAPRLDELSVADAGLRFALTVRGLGAEENRAHAIRLAQRLTEGG